MWRLIKFLFWLAVFAAIALIAYAYLGPILVPDQFTPPVTDVTAPVELDLN
jgi:hypothetical protein